MKQTLFNCVLVITSALFLTGCEEHSDYESAQSTKRCSNKPLMTIMYSTLTKCIYSAEIEGHKYIVFDGTNKGGIIHSESCQCKKEKKEGE